MKPAPAIFVLGLLFGATAGAYAQPQVQAQAPPERRLTTDPPGAEVDGPWALSISGFQGFDGSNSKTIQGVTGTSIVSGSNSGESIRLRLQRAGKKSGYTFDAGNTLIYYPGDSSLLSDSDIGASQWHKLGKDTTISAGETANRSPYYNIGAFPGIGNYSGTDLSRPFVPTLASGGQNTGTYRFTIETKLAHVIDTRNAIQATYNVTGNGVTGVPSRAVMHEVGGRYSHLINRTVGYHLGYSFGNAHFGGVSPTVLHNIDVGLDIHKELSFTRRTTFSFTTGTTFIKANPVNTAVVVGPTKEFNVLGHAVLTHYIGQTWSAAATYDRGWQMLDAVLIPYFSDGVTAAIGGNLGKRSTLGFSTAWISGAPLGINSVTRDRALIESAWFQISLGRKLTAYAQYTLYGQRFTLDGLSAIDLPQRFNRNTARVGLTLVLPRTHAPQPPVR